MKLIPAAVMCIMLSSLIAGCGRNDAPVPATEVKEKLFFKIQFIIGDVKIIGTSGKREAIAGDLVNINESVITGKKSLIDIVFGTSGIIRINENSRITVKSIADENSNDTLLDMDKGRVYVTLAKLKNRGFKVKTPTTVASVRGTSFTVVADTKGARLFVTKGTVTVNPVKDGKIFELETVSVNAGNKTAYIDKKSVENIITGRSEIHIMEMTPAEKIEIQNEIKDINVEIIPDLSTELKEEIKEQVESSAATVYPNKEVRHEASAKIKDNDELQEKIEGEAKLPAEKKEQDDSKLKKKKSSSFIPPSM